LVSVTDVPLSVAGSMSSEKIACGFASVLTLVAPFAGVVVVTVGGVAVVKLQLSAMIGVPFDSLIVAASWTVYVVPLARGALGVSVATFVAAL
jgi:hypothetical protein